MSGKLITSAAMQKQAERIKLILNKGEWKLDGNTATFDYTYQNSEVPVTLQGVKSVENLAVSGNLSTVPSTAYNTDIQVSISGENCKLIFNDKINDLIQNNFENGISSGIIHQSAAVRPTIILLLRAVRRIALF